MIRNSFSYAFALSLMIADFLAIMAAFAAAYIIRVDIDGRPLVRNIEGWEFLLIIAVLIPIWILVFAGLGLYSENIYRRKLRELLKLVVGTAIGVLIVIAYDFAQLETIFPARRVPIYAALLTVAFLITGRGFMTLLRRRLFRVGRGVARVLVIGSGPMTTEIIRQLSDTTSSGYKIVAAYSKKAYLKDAPQQLVTLASLKEAISYIDSGQINVVIQTEHFKDSKVNQKIIDKALSQHVAYKFVPSEEGILSNSIHVDLLAGVPVISTYPTSIIGWGQILKRGFDIALSSLVLALTLPLALLVGVIIKLSDPDGPLLYKHKRVTRFGDTIDVYKLRSMYWRYCAGKKTEEQIFTEMGREDLLKEWMRDQKVTDDPRIMPIGRFIRKYSIDELPQLWNVLAGDLSLIGPRAVTKKELSRYAKSSPLFLSIKPGITGLWQVSGRNEDSYEERIALDLYYVQNWSFLLDLKIVYLTVLAVLRGSGK